MHMTPETELLLLCARHHKSESAFNRLVDLLNSHLDWDNILQLAYQNNIIPLLAETFVGDLRSLVIKNVHDEIQDYYREATRYSLQLAVELLKVVDLFSDRHIDVVPFKGLVFSLLIYGDIAKRPGGDIDLLVRPELHKESEKLLSAVGYSVKMRDENAMQSSLWHKGKDIYIDLHWGIPPRSSRIKSDLLWRNLEPVNCLGKPVKTFCPQDALLITAVNATKEYWMPSLHHFSDITALAAGYSNKDWGKVVRRATRLNCKRALYSALMLCNQLLAFEIPDLISKQIAREDNLNLIVEEIKDHLFYDPSSYDRFEAKRTNRFIGTIDYQRTLLDSSFRRATFNFWRRVAPNDLDYRIVSLPKALHFLYYFIKAGRVLIRSLKFGNRG